MSKTNSVKDLGTTFENLIVKEESKRTNSWVYHFPNNVGQPSDILVLYMQDDILKVKYIECKYCSNDRFVFERIEENQLLVSELIEKNFPTAFVDYYVYLGLSNGDVYSMPIRKIKKLMQAKNSLNAKDIEDLGYYRYNVSRRIK